MQQSKFIYFRKQSRKRDENTPRVSFICGCKVFCSFISRIFNPLDLLYAGVKVIHVLYLELSGFLVKSRIMSECLNLYSK